MKKKSYLTYPYVIWSSLFIVVPLLLIVFFSFTDKTGGSIQFSLANFQRLMDPLYIKVFVRSISLALQSTVVCLILGYPVAYIISKRPSHKRVILIMLFILPMWMNFLLRTYAWLAILGKNGLLNNLLSMIGLNGVDILYTNTAVLLGMVYNFLPFMVLPIYTSLLKMDQDLINAAMDLGAKPMYTLKKVILPQIKPGIISGFLIAFTMSIDDFIISFFNTGNGVTNLSIEVYSMAKRGIKPEINALTTLMFVTVLILLLLSNKKQSIVRGE